MIAISGGNVALLTAMGFAGARLVIRSARGVSILTIIAVATYGWVVGADASVARAVAAAILYLAIGIAGLRPPPLAVLRVAAIVLVAIDPLTVLDIGAWLSFAATLGIVSYGPAWTRRLLGAPVRGTAHALGRLTAGLIVATIAAETVLLPVTVSAFSRLSRGRGAESRRHSAMAAVRSRGSLSSLFADAAHLASGAGLSRRSPRLLLTSARWSIGGHGCVARSPSESGVVDDVLRRASLCLRCDVHRLHAFAIETCVLCLVIVTAPFLSAAQPAPAPAVTVIDVDGVKRCCSDAGRSRCRGPAGAPGRSTLVQRVVAGLWSLPAASSRLAGCRTAIAITWVALRQCFAISPGDLGKACPFRGSGSGACVPSVTNCAFHGMRACGSVGRVVVESIHAAPGGRQQ